MHNNISVLAVVALLAAAVPGTSDANSQADRLRQLEEQMREMQAELERLRAEQAATKQEVEETRESAVITSGKSPGSFVLPGSKTEITLGGYVKGDFIYDIDESTGDLFVPESLTTSGPDEQRFRAHARQSRLFITTSTPTDQGPLATRFEGDFFGGGGNEVFSNSSPFRLRHAFGSWNGIIAGQTWTNFMPIESYPSTVDFNGPAGIPFIRQAQLRYTFSPDEHLSFSGSIENSEFSGRSATGTFSESTTLGIRAGVDQAPDFTLAATYKDDWGLVKLAGVGRYLGSPNGEGDGDFGWGINASGNAALWEGGLIQGSFTYGEGVGRYILNGFAQDGFVDANGDVEAIGAYGVTVALRQQLTESVAAGVAYGRFAVLDTFSNSDLDNVNTVHASLFYSPIPRLTFGAEVIWGNREDADGTSDDAIRLQSSVQVNF